MSTVAGHVSTSRSRAMGAVYLAIAVLILLLGSGAEGEAGFGLATRNDYFEVPRLILPTRGTLMLLALIAAFLGGIQLARGFGRRTYAVLGIVVGCFIAGFLVWATQGQSMNLLGMLQSTVLRAVPITLGAMSGILCERSGVINIAIEGMMLTAAFTGALVASAAGSLLVGTVLAIVVGALLGGFLGVFAIKYRVDQIIAGTVINIFALGITSYLAAQVLTRYAHLNSPGRFGVVSVPVLSRIPLIGPIFFSNNIFVYLMLISVVVLTVALFRTRWGLRARAVGEHPRAADTVGINVFSVRYRNVILGGMAAGLAGAYFTLGSVGRFDQGMTGGRGFIALAAMIFGRWHPVGALGAALVFGFADSLQNKLAILNVPIASEFLLMAPYIATILVVAGVVGRARPPAADGQPYVKQ